MATPRRSRVSGSYDDMQSVTTRVATRNGSGADRPFHSLIEVLDEVFVNASTRSYIWPITMDIHQ